MNDDLSTLVLIMWYVPSKFDECCHLLRAQPEMCVRDLIEQIKQEIDSNWAKDPGISLELANIIIAIGMIRGEIGHVALGMMARGDSIRMLGAVQEAWSTLRLAGKLYLADGDQVGWARTRIGRMALGPTLNRVRLVECESRRAHKIFELYGEYDRALRLDVNLAYMYQQIGQYQQALNINQNALLAAEKLGEDGHFYQLRLYTNIGYIYTELGNLRQALLFHEQAYAASQEQHETTVSAWAQNNLAYISLLQGRYRDALNRLFLVEQITDNLPVEHTDAQRLIVKCYLNLNRYSEARNLAKEIVKVSREQSQHYESGYALMDLAVAEAELGYLDAAQEALDEAEAIFSYSGAHTWVANVHLRRGQIALKQNHLDIALAQAETAAQYFETNNEQVSYGTAMLLYAQAALAAGDLETPAAIAHDILKIARRSRVPWLRYSSHLLLGRVADTKINIRKAIRHHEVAARTIERVQHNLTITLRPGFLENKEDALRGLIKLYLKTGQTTRAFDTVERAKSQTVLNHLANRENLRWLRNDDRSQALIQKLEELRLDHHGYYQLAFNLPFSEERPLNKSIQDQAKRELAQCEQKIRAITEQLYLQGDNTRLHDVNPPPVKEIQAKLDDDALLITFYTNSRSLWAFVADRNNLDAQMLPMTPRDFDRKLRQLQFDIACALKIGAYKGPYSAEAKTLTLMTQQQLQDFYIGLLEPLVDRLQGKRRLIIVPYGALHYLPFHLLYTGKQYLIEFARNRGVTFSRVIDRTAPKAA